MGKKEEGREEGTESWGRHSNTFPSLTFYSCSAHQVCVAEVERLHQIKLLGNEILGHPTLNSTFIRPVKTDL